MTVSCEAFLDYAYEGDVKLPFTVRIQNMITKMIGAIQKFILKIRSLKGERVVPIKVLNAYKALSQEAFNNVQKCQNAVKTNSNPTVPFAEPYDSPNYKILFSEDIKNRTSPGEYVKIQSSEVLNRMNGAITALTAAKNGLRSVDKESSPGVAQGFSQMILWCKYMIKISNRVLSYKNMYVEKKHLPNTPIDDEKKQANEAYTEFEREITLAIVTEGLSDLFKRKPKVESTAEKYLKRYQNNSLERR